LINASHFIVSVDIGDVIVTISSVNTYFTGKKKFLFLDDNPARKIDREYTRIRNIR
jgi:hypothetical protein